MYIIKAAEYLCREILECSEEIAELFWSPTLDELNSSERKLTKSLKLFFIYLLETSSKYFTVGMDNKRLTNSYVLDLAKGYMRPSQNSKIFFINYEVV